MVRTVSTALSAIFLTATITPCLGQTGAAGVVDRFYEGVEKADGAILGEVLADDAVIRLADLGFEMTTEEFVDSMDTWSEVAATMTMRVKPAPEATDTDETVVRLVCYEFPANTSLTRETSTVVDGKITANMQEEIGESCEGF